MLFIYTNNILTLCTIDLYQCMFQVTIVLQYFHKGNLRSSDVWSYGMVMCEIWSLGKKLLPQLSPPQVHGIIIDHWISICVCSLLEVHMKFVISHYIL